MADLFSRCPLVSLPCCRILTDAAVALARLWIVHFVATQFCGCDGRFVQILRPLSLASLLLLPISVLPLLLGVSGFTGPAAAILGVSAILTVIANAAITVFVFGAVDDMPQLTAFITSIITSYALSFAIGYATHAFRP
jgi:hypothetical protein